MGGYQCARCGEWHDELPFAYGSHAPDSYKQIPSDERDRRALLNADQCIVDNEFFFVRANIELPVLDAADNFQWGVWVSLSEDSFERMSKLWESPGRESEPPYFGWLSTTLRPSVYPATLNLKTHVHTQPLGVRPLIELEHTDHPLAVEQRTGITLARVREFAEKLLHE